MSDALRSDLQVILQFPLPSGEWRCIGLKGVPIVQPCMIVFSPLADTPLEQTLCSSLSDSLVTHLRSVNGQQIVPPCGQPIPDPEFCHARTVASCRKLMVIVGDGTGSMSSSHRGLHWKSRGYDVLPVLKSGTNASSVLHQPIAKLHASYWNTSPTECVSAILSAAGIVPEESRIFISYRRLESQPLADQLFDELTHHNFDVFLDRFRMPPGADFQSRLAEEMEDKSLVLVLESPNILQSPWTEFEINFAKTRRLGLLALQIPGGICVPCVDPASREVLSRADFEPGLGSTRLTDVALQRVVQSVKNAHDRALLWRRQQLRDVIRDALTQEGASPPSMSTRGLLCTQGSGRDYAIWPAPRAPRLPDFHRADVDRDPQARAVVVGPGAYLTDNRQAQTIWLSKLSKVPFIDEGQVLNMAREIVKGSL